MQVHQHAPKPPNRPPHRSPQSAHTHVADTASIIAPVSALQCCPNTYPAFAKEIKAPARAHPPHSKRLAPRTVAHHHLHQPAHEGQRLQLREAAPPPRCHSRTYATRATARWPKTLRSRRVKHGLPPFCAFGDCEAYASLQGMLRKQSGKHHCRRPLPPPSAAPPATASSISSAPSCPQLAHTAGRVLLQQLRPSCPRR